MDGVQVTVTVPLVFGLGFRVGIPGMLGSLKSMLTRWARTSNGDAEPAR